VKYPVVLLLLILGCGTVKPTPQPIPVVVHDTIHVTTTIRDTQTITLFNIDTVKHLSFADFGAAGDGNHDDADAITAACNYVISHPQELIAPIGSFYISHPILLQNNGRYFTIHISGLLSNKSSSNEYLSKIIYGGKSGYAFGIQFGRSVVIENLTIIGQYTFPNTVTNANIGVLKFSDWIDPSITDTRTAPYSAIVIDPNQNASGSRGGTSDVTIRNCSIKQWMVGICLSPNGVTQNDEMINIIEDDIEAVRICVAIGQDQSKTVNIKGLKVWSSVYTVLDGLNYGSGTGGGSVFCENWNIAGNCKELFNLNTNRFPLSCKDIYSESLFRIGNVGNGTGANFVNTEIDFLSGQGMPEADYLIQGQANFYGGMLRYYDNDGGHRLNFATIGFSRYSFMFRDMTLTGLPITQGLYGTPTNTWMAPIFSNVHEYNTGLDMSKRSDTLIYSVMSNFIVDRINWTATASVSGAQVNDYLIAEPTSTTATYYDGSGYCTTKVLGRITSVSGNTVTLDHISVNAYSGGNYGRIFIGRIK
jgi:hypothetical protein